MKKRIWLLLIGMIFLTGCSGLMTGDYRELTYEQVQQYAQQTLTAQASQPETGSGQEGLLIRPVVNTPTSEGITVVLPQDQDTQDLIIHPNYNIPTALPTSTPLVPAYPVYQQPTVVYSTPNYAQQVNTVCDRVRFIDDVTIPDNTQMAPGQVFRKIWRIQNAGSCTWTAGYQLVFSGGDAMGDNLAVNLPGTVAPGETIDIGIDLTAPKAFGVFQSNWKLRNPSGYTFGTANSENDAIWAKIVVGNNINISTVAPGVTPVNTGCTLLSVDPAYRATLSRGEEADFSFRVRNDSGVTWDAANFDVAFIDGENMLKRKDQTRRDLANDVPPGTAFTYVFDAVVPDTPGTYTMTMGVVQGYEVYCSVDLTVTVVY